MDARRVAREVAAAAPVDLQTLDRHPGGADAHDAAGARAFEDHAPLPAKRERLVDQDVAGVGAGRDDQHLVRGRRVDEPLQDRRSRGRRPPFQGAGRGRVILRRSRGTAREPRHSGQSRQASHAPASVRRWPRQASHSAASSSRVDAAIA